MKKIFTSLIAAGFTLFPIFADGIMVVNAGKGETKEFKLDDITSIKFENESIVIDSSTPFTSPTADIESIRFQLDSGVADVMADGAIKFYCADNKIYIQSDNKIENVAIYSTTGQRVYYMPEWNGEWIDITDLQKGVYILNVNEMAFKFVR